jgi:hypothetical protein
LVFFWNNERVKNWSNVGKSFLVVNLVTIKTSANKFEAIEAQLTERIILLKFQPELCCMEGGGRQVSL